jgi:hypothetical protein
MNGHNVWSSLRSKSPFKLWCRHHSFWGSNLVHSVGPRFETRSWQCFRSTFFFLSGIFSLSPVWFWQSVPVQCLVTVQSSWCHRWFCPLGAEIFFLFGDFIGIFFFGLVGLSWWFSVNFESYFCGFVLRALARLSPFYFRHFIWVRSTFSIAWLPCRISFFFLVAWFFDGQTRGRVFFLGGEM